jgi:hypothetical protein
MASQGNDTERVSASFGNNPPERDPSHWQSLTEGYYLLALTEAMRWLLGAISPELDGSPEVSAVASPPLPSRLAISVAGVPELHRLGTFFNVQLEWGYLNSRLVF